MFINVGGRAIVPDMPGVDKVSVHQTPAFSRSIGCLAIRGRGRQYIGLEFAQMYRRFGAEVTVVEKSPRLIARRRGSSESIGEILIAEGIHVRVSAECIALAPHAEGVAVSVDCHQGDPVAVGSHVLLAVGRRPNTDDLGLDRAGVRTDERLHHGR